MGQEKSKPSQDDTREKLLAAAHSQFADRGFYGASIAQIAGEVGLTKQALLYHFKRKEDLYSAVLKGISVRLLAALRNRNDRDRTPAEQFERMIANLYIAARDNPLDTKVLMRELLDDQRRDALPSEWFLKTCLDEMVDALGAIQSFEQLSFSEKFSRIYLLMSAIQYFAASESVMTRFYGPQEASSIAQDYPKELRAHVHRLIESVE
ncbi:TetR family transcriptional regulator [Erythrobacter sp. Alg231-14]|uniref:TetR family transcriptional regulator n=1 Tax=Erythrobacter sp. Alg231-14 TaxID=1922225 RepID=UPI000D557413